MKTAIVSISLGLGLLVAHSGAFAGKAAPKACFADAAKAKEHLEKHVTYPAKGKDIKAACKKEMPDEFTKAERACANKKIKDKTEYRSAEDVEKALGL